jgi:hypothetical protein
MEHAQMQKWLLMHYSLPAEPSALRVRVWRKLKRLGAIFYQDSVWVLPDRPRTHEHLQWLAVEIIELGGNSALWESRFALAGKDESLVELFNAQVEKACSALLERLEISETDIDALSREYLQIRHRDYFHSRMGAEVRARLSRLRGGKA